MSNPINFNKKKSEEEKENPYKGSFVAPKSFDNPSR